LLRLCDLHHHPACRLSAEGTILCTRPRSNSFAFVIVART
jgi:hypothetical protein